MKKYLSSILFLSLIAFMSSCVNEEIIEQSNDPTKEVSESPLQLTLSNGMTVLKEGDYYVYQGDIFFTEETIQELSSTSRAGLDTSKLRWGYTINYYFDENEIPNSSRITEAIAHWSEATNLSFTRIYTQTGTYIKFVNGYDVTATIGLGKPISGPREIKVGTNATYGNIIHEIGHALGLIHEHCRPDRDTYITVNTFNIKADRQSQYEKCNNAYCSQFIVPFDYNSIMMYPSENNSDAIDPSIPIMRKNNDYSNQSFGGQRFYLSEEDCALFNRYLYPNEKVKIEGDAVVGSPATKTYRINPPSGSSVSWTLAPTSNAAILTGWNSNTVTIRFTGIESNITLIANVTTPNGYHLQRTKTIRSAAYPIVTDILMYKYCQGAGEYTLEANVTNPDNATLTWTTDGTLYDILYPDDVNFQQYPNLFKAVDFYSAGMHTVSVTASNSVDNSTFSKAFYIDDCKSMFMSLYPNPSTNGQIMVSIGTETKMGKNTIASSSAIFNIYYKGKKVYSTKLSSKDNNVDLSSLEEGEYVAELIDEVNKLVLHQSLYIGKKYNNKN